ncbi:MAG TPA: hypothetical protein VFS21_33615 [Roseiflexaceae bacterium]|nr:hypothetical protein [Roseiflexaceae bacterium]
MGRGASGWMVWAGIALILLTGLVHLVEAPEYFTKAAYVGILFLLNGAGAVLAALGIYRGSKDIGWGLGLLIAAASLVAYLISRTIGLPGLEVAPWNVPAGLVALAVEALFVLVAIRALTLPDVPLPHGLVRRGEEQTAVE